MNFDKAKDFGLIACVVCSLFVSAYFVPHGGGPGESRNIHVYAVEASDSTKGWVGDTDAVRLGVEAAIDDAATRTKVRLAGETISYDVIRNASALENMLSNPPERSVLINTHGECVPLPNSYLSPWVRIDSPSDGAVLNRTGGLTVQATVTAVIGTQLAGVGFAVVPTGCEPSTYYHMDPTGSGDHFDSVFYPLEVTGDYTALVRARTTRGLYACAYVNIHYIGKDNPCDAPYTAPGLYKRLCPYVYAGTYIGFVKDNTILAESNGSIVDRYRLENELEQDAHGNYLLRLSESGDKQSFFDYVQLLGVDHQRSVGIGLNSNGSVLTYENPHLPLEAYAHEIGNAYFGIDVAWWLMQADDRGRQFLDGDWLDLSFGFLNVSLGAKLILRMGTQAQGVVSVQRFNDSGLWETVASVMPRVCWSTCVLNLSSCLPDPLSECRFRLLFNGSSWIDFAGFDTSAESSVAVHEGELVSVQDYSGINATLGDLLYDDGVCARLRYGFDIDLSFRLPELNDSGLKRDFIFVAKGYYSERTDQMLGGMGEGGGTGHPVDMNANWKDWFDLIEDCCRTKGWIWANVAGYSFYYFGNVAFWSLMGPSYNPSADHPRQPCQDGLKQYLGKDVECKPNDGHVAELGFDYVERSGFWDTYLGFDGHRNVSAFRPIDRNAAIPWNMFFYKDKGDASWATATIAMNVTEMGTANQPGIFVHNGFSKDPDMDGTPDTFDDDWLKGYVATALAIEEARTFVALPTIQQDGTYSIHTAGFGVVMRAADRGRNMDDRGPYTYVRCLFTVGAHYPRTPHGVGNAYWFLSHADIELPDASDVRYVIREDESGLDLGEDTEFMNDWHWYAISTLAGFVPVYGVVLGPALDAVPLIIQYFQPVWESAPGPQDHAWAKGTWIDSDSNDKGTIVFFIEIRMYGEEHTGIRTYTFDTLMTSWTGLWSQLYTDWRVYEMSNTRQLTFEVDWGI